MKRICIQFYEFRNFPTHYVEVSVDDKLTNAQITDFIYDLAGNFCKVAGCSSWEVLQKRVY